MRRRGRSQTVRNSSTVPFLHPAPLDLSPRIYPLLLLPPEILGAALQTAGSISAKLGFGAENGAAWAPAAWTRDKCVQAGLGSADSVVCNGAALGGRGISLAVMAALNGGGLALVLLGMRNGGALRATVRAMAAGTLFGAAAGAWIFGERLSLEWALGATLTLLGVILLSERDGSEVTAPVAAPPPQRTRGRVRKRQQLT